MDTSRFIKQEVINKNNEKGTVVEFDEKKVTVIYLETTKTYDVVVAFRSGFLRFLDDELNRIVLDFIEGKYQENKAKEEQIKKIEKKVRTKIEKVSGQFERISRKNAVMQYLFGKDFVYPPYHEFMKKHKYRIQRKTKSIYFQSIPYPIKYHI